VCARVAWLMVGGGGVVAHRRSTRVEFSDGTTFGFFRRERPELRTNSAGDPTHLITGIEYFADHPGQPNNHQYSFTIVQEVDLSGGFIPD
jgi:hypothetical protein